MCTNLASSSRHYEFPQSDSLKFKTEIFSFKNIKKNKQIKGQSLTPRSDQDRISPYNIKHTTDENKKKPLRGLLVDPIPNSLNQHHKTFMEESKENYL